MLTVKRVVASRDQIFGYRINISRAKASVVSIILFGLLTVLMIADTFISNVNSLQSQHPQTQVLKRSNPEPLTISTQRIIANPIREEVSINIIGQQQFRRKLPENELFASDELTQKFHGRVLEFMNRDCEVQFFMTWISSAESFGNREILAVESVFKSHPRSCLMILSRTMDSPRGYTILKPVLDRGFKVQAVAPDLPFLLKNTPAESWLDDMKSGKKEPGGIPLAQNLSNLMRLAALYKYGGVYLDTDFIVLKSFKGLKNTIGAQSVDANSKNWTRLNNAVLIFDMNHPLLFKFMEEFALTFDGNKWGHNGPYMVSRVVLRVEGRPGYNFTILPPVAFYPVDWIRIKRLFNVPKDLAESRWVEAKLHQLKGQAYGVHLWNKQSSKLVVEEGSAMAGLILEHCVLCEHVYSS